MGGTENNQNAAKPPGEHLVANLIIRCHPEEKTQWVRASAGRKLSAWIRQNLNAAARRKLATKPATKNVKP
jgi:hypothetical protein